MGSPVQLRGVANLLDDIVQYFPSPDKRSVAGINTKTNEIFEANYDFAKAKSAQVFKTIVDPFIGKYSMIKVKSGVIKSDDVIFNIDKDAEQKLNKLYVFEGSKPIEIPELHAGDIGAIAKLDKARTGDTLSTKATPIRYGKIEVSIPYTYKRYRAKNKGDEDKVAQALQKISHEDLTMKVVNDSENRQTLLYGMGDQHLEMIAERIAHEVQESRLNWKDRRLHSVRRSARVPMWNAKYKKQSGGHGQYGHVKMRFEPLGRSGNTLCIRTG